MHQSLHVIMKMSVLWNQEVHTDREVMANWSDIIITNRKEKMYILMNVAKSFRKYLSNIRESMKSRHYRKRPYWPQQTYCGKYNVEVERS
jgi:hypothetical protein